jgi:putative nucleotidyltransferase with HDIG domain
VDEPRRAEELARHLVAAIRSRGLYPDTHPLVRRNIDNLAASLADALRLGPSVTIGFLGDDIVVGKARLKRSAALLSLARHFRERQIDTLTLSRELGREGLRAVLGVLADRDPRPLVDRLDQLQIKGCEVGVLAAAEAQAGSDLGIGAARAVYDMAVRTAEVLWGEAFAEGEPDPGAAQEIIDSLSNAVSLNRAAMISLTSIKSHEVYTFSHMVNVSVLTMAQARTLGIQGPLLREFGVAGLMHDIGKTKTPPELLNKPGRLTDEETAVVRRHVVDGAQILRHTPDIPPLASVVAFEHHLRLDLSGYPERIGHRELNLCTMLVSIADVFDALRTNRAYRESLPSARVRAMLAAQSGTAFEPTLLRRFITLMGIFPVGTLVRLQTGEIAVVIDEHPTDPFRPLVRVVCDSDGRKLPIDWDVNIAETDDRGKHPYSVAEAVDASSVRIDPLAVIGQPGTVSAS